MNFGKNIICPCCDYMSYRPVWILSRVDEPCPAPAGESAQRPANLTVEEAVQERQEDSLK